jgi:predicted dienelactone hydrolase
MRRLPLLVLLAACTPEEVADTDTVVPPLDRGAHDPGRTTIDYVDDRGEDMTIEVWYPARIPDGTAPTPYDDVPIALDSVVEAPADLSGAPYPVIAFSHGFGGVRYQSASLVEHLVSHGYVVVSADHPGSILLDQRREFETILRRPSDVVSAVDKLFEETTASEGLLAGLAVEGEIAMMGHSAGAITTQGVAGGAWDVTFAETFCAEGGQTGCGFLDEIDHDEVAERAVVDDRIHRAVLLSPGAWYAFGESGRGLAEMVPTLTLTGDADTVLEYDSEARPVYEALSTPRWLGTIVDAGHYAAFSDMCALLSFFGDCTGPDEGFLDSATGQRLTTLLVTAWLGREHKGQDYDAWLDPDALATEAQLVWEADE